MDPALRSDEPSPALVNLFRAIREEIQEHADRLAEAIKQIPDD